MSRDSATSDTGTDQLQWPSTVTMLGVLTAFVGAIVYVRLLVLVKRLKSVVTRD